MKSRTKWLCAGLAFAVVLALAVFCAYELRGMRRDVRRTLCVHNLKIVAIALNIYAEEHEGTFPDTLSALHPTYIPNLEVLICPELQVTYARERGVTHPFTSTPTAEEIDTLCSYEYVPGLSAIGDKDTVIAYEKEDNHFGKGHSLLYLDGRGAWEPPENWRGGPPNKNLPEALKAAATAKTLHKD